MTNKSPSSPKNIIEYSGFPEDFSGVKTREEVIGNNRKKDGNINAGTQKILTFLDNIEVHLKKTGNGLTGLEYLYYLYVVKESTPRELDTAVGHFSNYTSTIGVSELLRKTFGWGKNRTHNISSKKNINLTEESFVSQVENILLNKIKDNNNKGKEVKYIKKDRSISKAKVLFVDLGICSHENFEDEIITLREEYGAADVVLAMNSIILHYSGGNFRLSNKNIELLDSEVASKLKEAWENGWSNLFLDNLEGETAGVQLLLKSAHQFAQSGVRGLDFLQSFLITGKEKKEISKKSLIRKICIANGYINSSLLNALMSLGVEKKQAILIVNNIKTNKTEAYKKETTENNLEVSHVVVPNDFMTEIKILWLEEKASLNIDKIKALLGNFKGLRIEDIHRVLQDTEMRNQVFTGIEIHKRTRKHWSREYAISEFSRFAPDFIQTLYRVSEENQNAE